MTKGNREKIIIHTSIQGIIMNFVLVVAKAIVGFIAGSISIILDALNNFTDMLSSAVTIFGTKLAGRAPDREHPYGHGRIEYLTAMIVGIIILVAGVTALVEAIPKIFNPQLAEYSLATIIVVTLAILIKFFFGRHIRSVGEKINSGSLVASGLDAMLDSLLSFGTLVGVIISMVWGISVDGWIGAAISLLIIKSSIEVLRDGWQDILGQRVDSTLSHRIKAEICKFPMVGGAYDLALHDYGPNEVIGSVHIQVPDRLTAQEIHRLSREITAKIHSEFRVVLTVGIYAENTSTKAGREMRQHLEQIVSAEPTILQMHGFYVDVPQKLVSFDLIFDHGNKDKSKIASRITRVMRKQFPDYKFQVVIDVDVSD